MCSHSVSAYKQFINLINPLSIQFYQLLGYKPYINSASPETPQNSTTINSTSSTAQHPQRRFYQIVQYAYLKHISTDNDNNQKVFFNFWHCP